MQLRRKHSQFKREIKLREEIRGRNSSFMLFFCPNNCIYFCIKWREKNRSHNCNSNTGNSEGCTKSCHKILELEVTLDDPPRQRDFKLVLVAKCFFPPNEIFSSTSHIKKDKCSAFFPEVWAGIPKHHPAGSSSHF